MKPIQAARIRPVLRRNCHACDANNNSHRPAGPCIAPDRYPAAAAATVAAAHHSNVVQRASTEPSNTALAVRWVAVSGSTAGTPAS